MSTWSFLEARTRVLECAQAQQNVEHVPLTKAHQRHLSQALAVHENIPIADNSAMDGFALRAAEAREAFQATEAHGANQQNTFLTIQDILAAEQVAQQPLKAQHAIRLMTGAPIPTGADAVVMKEHTRTEADRLWVLQTPKVGQHIRLAGADIRAGSQLFKRGACLNAGMLGMLASIGVTQVPVLTKPTVGILSTGNEVVPPETTPIRAGMVRDSNTYALAALAEAAGAVPSLLGIAADDPQHLKNTLQQALTQFDIVITCGGVSAGDFDYVKTIIDELAMDVHFRGVAIKPGKPVIFASNQKTLFFGLPGNPVSCMVGFLQLIRPAILSILGAEQALCPQIKMPLVDGYRKTDNKRHFLRATVQANADGVLAATLSGGQESNQLHAMGAANAFVVVEEEAKHIAPQQSVWVELFAPILSA